MEKIKIVCTSGISLNLSDFLVYPGKLKKHSQLEIERLCDSIVNDGFLFPIAVGKLKDKNYVIDGECRLFALQELEYRGYEIPSIPVFYVRCNEDTIKKNILIATSVNHCVTKNGLIKFVEDKNIDLKQFAFSEGELLDFYTVSDIDRYFEIAKSTKEKGLTGKEDYLGLLQGNEI